MGIGAQIERAVDRPGLEFDMNGDHILNGKESDGPHRRGDGGPVACSGLAMLSGCATRGSPTMKGARFKGGRPVVRYGSAGAERMRRLCPAVGQCTWS